MHRELGLGWSYRTTLAQDLIVDSPCPVTAQLVASIHQPWRASVRECLDRWLRLDSAARESAYLVLEGPEPNLRRTLNAAEIAKLA